MQRIMLTLSEGQWQALRLLSFQQGKPMTKLVREAIDRVYGTEDDIPPPGRPPYKQHTR